MARSAEIQRAIYNRDYATLSIKGSRGAKKTNRMRAQRREQESVFAQRRAEVRSEEEYERQISANEHILSIDGEPVDN